LGLIWICMVALTNPVGDFPLNDDWAYGYSVPKVIRAGATSFLRLDRPESFWTGVVGLTLLFAVWFFVYRFAIIYCGSRACRSPRNYGILRELKTSRSIATLGALALACCPIYFALSLTFMTDVPFTAFAIASLYFFIRGMRTESRLTIAVSFLLATMAILIRQTGLALPVAFACALLTKKG